jgi:MoaA/NifB/PqqE/SkfB family radical SAM enzyme
MQEDGEVSEMRDPAPSVALLRSAILEGAPAWEWEFDWHLTNRCNFLCEYCHPQIRTALNRKHLKEPPADLVVGRFDQTGRTCLVHMSGGEPFEFPDFITLCAGLAQRHYLSINTNLESRLVDTFARKVPASRVPKIVAALHMPERDRRGISLDLFVANFQALRSSGFDVEALYIAWPPLFSRLEADVEALGARGVSPLRVKVFKGFWEGVRYPAGYTDAQRAVLLRRSGSYGLNQAYIDGPTSFRGQACWAGATSVKVTVTGDVRRCASTAGACGNIYDGTFAPNSEALPCTARRFMVLSQCRAYLADPPPLHDPGSSAV